MIDLNKTKNNEGGFTTDNIFVKFYRLPLTIKAYTVSNSDDSYTVIINTNITCEQQKLSYQHEVNHINNGDYERTLPVDMIEIYAHRLEV